MFRLCTISFTLLNLYARNPYIDYLEKYCLKYALDIKIVYSLCIQENSRFNPAVVNSSGAVGIMQIRPIAFQEYCRVKKIKKKYTKKEIIKLLKKPKTNIEIGCWYLRYMLDKCNGNYVLALIYYNSGHNTEDFNFNYPNAILLRCMNW